MQRAATLVRCPLNLVARHCAATLPDSLIERERLLKALSFWFADSHPAMVGVRAQLALLEAQRNLQRSLVETLDKELAGRAS